jgi:ABC-2 type transport system permease protein
MDVLYLARGSLEAAVYYVAELLIGVAAVTATFLLAERFDGFGAWSVPQILFMLGYALLVRALIEMFFSYNVAYISRRIGRGQLDHLLIQPLPLWMALLSEGFAPLSGSGMLVPAGFLLVAAGRQLTLQVSPGWIVLVLIDLLASIVIVLAFEYIWGSLAFWLPRAAEEINSQTWDLLVTLTPFPLDGMAGWALASLVTFVPAGLVAWYPSRALLGVAPLTWTSVVVLPGAALLFGTLAAWTFTRGLQRYACTGSSRYLEYGHRR